MVQFAREVDDLALRIGIAGHGWGVRRNELPNNWQVVGPLYGRAYGEWIRQSKIVIAPVHTKMIIDGIRQPGDEDTTRTYELAAAFCFFLHRRTPYVKKVYDENTEVPMWSSAKELGEKVRYYLRRESERHAMAAAAHARAVPAYSTQSRAMEVLEHIRIRLNERMKR
jgi:spore maturation protein CgeB